MLITTMWLRETIKKAGGFSYTRFIARRYLRLAPMLVVGIIFQIIAGAASGPKGLQEKMAAVRENKRQRCHG